MLLSNWAWGTVGQCTGWRKQDQTVIGGVDAVAVAVDADTCLDTVGIRSGIVAGIVGLA